MALPTAGTFSASDLVKVQMKSDQMWVDNIGTGYYDSEVDTVLAILKEQKTSDSFRELRSSEKDKTVTMVWLNDCTETVADCSNDCTVGGDELASDSEDYALNICKTTGFTVKEKELRGNVFSPDELIARGMLQKIKLLDEQLNVAILAKIEAGRGVNEYLPDGWENVDSDTVVPSSEFGTNMIPRLIMTGKINRFKNPFVLSGEALWYEQWNAMIDQMNGEGKGDASRFTKIRLYNDLFNIDSANAPNKKLYLIHQGALALITKSYYNIKPVTYMDNVRYSVPSMKIPGVYYDVIYKNECSSNEMLHKFSLTLNAGIFLNPTGCSETRTGIISFLKDPAT